MNLYTHAVLANHLLPLVRPADSAAYLWGAVAPDIRYLAGMPRAQTHLPLEKIDTWREQFPGCASFIQGYRVHLLIDQVDPLEAICASLPLRLFRPVLVKRLRSRMAAVAIELYYHRTQPQGIALAGSHNPVLDSLGITPQQSAEFASVLAGYLPAPSFQSAAAAFARLGLIEDTRVERYAAEYRRLQENPALLALLMWSVKRARLEDNLRQRWLSQSG